MNEKRKEPPEDLLKSYFAEEVENIRVPSFPDPLNAVFRTAEGRTSKIDLEIEKPMPRPGGKTGGGLALNIARIAAALFLCLGCLNLYTGIGPKTLLSDEIARIYHEQNLKEKVETAFLSAHTFLTTYFYNRNIQGEKQ